MSEKSAIEWTNATWNPTTGCTKVSPACANCYIERTPPFRIKGRKFVNGHIPIQFHPERLEMPLRRRKPTVYFVNSLSDLFHDHIPWSFLDSVFDTMRESPQHTFQVLTKRTASMRMYMENWLFHHGAPLPNVWLGASTENQPMYDKRIGDLLRTPAAIHFLSIEPMLGPIDLRMGGMSLPDYSPHDPLPQIDWAIVGGESGPRVRPTHPDWVRSIRDQCVTAGVWFFFKQWGGKTAKAGGRTLDGRTWDEMPGQR